MPRISLWVIAFGIGTAFQIWRGSFGDATIFGIAALLLVFNSNFAHQEPLWNFSSQSRLMSRSVVLPLIALVALVLYLLPLHSVIPASFFIAIAPLVVAYTWFSDRPEVIKPDASMYISAKMYASIGILTSIWEVLNYILAERSHNDNTYPTISVLMDPVLANHLGKLLFLIIWIAAGMQFLRPARIE